MEVENEDDAVEAIRRTSPNSNNSTHRRRNLITPPPPVASRTVPAALNVIGVQDRRSGWNHRPQNPVALRQRFRPASPRRSTRQHRMRRTAAVTGHGPAEGTAVCQRSPGERSRRPGLQHLNQHYADLLKKTKKNTVTVMLVNK